MEELDKIFEEGPEQAAEEPEVKEETPTQPRDDSGRFTKETGVEDAVESAVEETEGQNSEEPVVPTEQPLPKEEYQALKAERQKRQELERQMAAMQQKFATQQQVQQPQEQPPGFWDDPDKAIEARIGQATEIAIQRYEQQQTMRRIEASEAAAQAKYTDYGDAFTHFQQAASVNPGLIQQMQVASDPAEFAYKTGKRAMELERVGSLDELLNERLKAERAKWEEEVKAKVPAPKLPSSTATDGTVGDRRGPAPPSEFSLEAVFDD